MPLRLAAAACLLFVSRPAPAAGPPVANALATDRVEPPVIPVGLDAYRMWDRWHHQRIGARAHMRSTYDRTGHNHHADASHFLYQLADDRNVTLDVEGPGVLYFVRHNHWHGSPWKYVVDGNEHVVKETSTADPNNPAPNSVFLPEAAFPNPLTWTWSITKGADLSWVPVSFERSFRMEYGRTRYGTGYYIFHRYVPGANLSLPIRSWDASSPDPDVLDLIRRSGTDLTPNPNSEASRTQGIYTVFDKIDLAGPTTLIELTGSGDALVAPVGGDAPAPGLIRKIRLSVPEASALDLSKVRLRVTWDGREHPSIDAPVPLFFGTGTLYNHDGREYLVKAFPVNVRFADGRIDLACYFPMPYFRSAKFELVPEPGVAIPDLAWEVRTHPLDAPPNHVGYFHATYRDHPEPKRGHDLVLLDTKETEGGGDWSGQLIGTSFIFSHDAILTTLEGDPRFFFDDSRTPQAQGTGTEEWGGGGDYWGGRTMTLPFAGHPVGGPHKKPRSELDKIESAYRFLLADLMPFGRNALIRLEHGGVNDSTEHYETVAYWYGLPAPSLVKTDALDVGDLESEQTHGYASPDATEPAELTSRYEWGPDTLDGVEIYPAHTENGRTTTGVSEFTLKIDPKNVGVMLRRTLDYAYPNQRAEVSIADASDPAADVDFEPAGIWYLAGSNAPVFSDPKEELGATQHVVRESNRRFRDDEFLVPRELTEGRSAIRVRVKFTRVDRPLFPGHPLPPLAWSELGYAAYSFILPDFAPVD